MDAELRKVERAVSRGTVGATELAELAKFHRRLGEGRTAHGLACRALALDPRCECRECIPCGWSAFGWGAVPWQKPSLGEPARLDLEPEDAGKWIDLGGGIAARIPEHVGEVIAVDFAAGTVAWRKPWKHEGAREVAAAGGRTWMLREVWEADEPMPEVVLLDGRLDEIASVSCGLTGFARLRVLDEETVAVVLGIGADADRVRQAFPDLSCLQLPRLAYAETTRIAAAGGHLVALLGHSRERFGPATLTGIRRDGSVAWVLPEGSVVADELLDSSGMWSPDAILAGNPLPLLRGDRMALPGAYVAPVQGRTGEVGPATHVGTPWPDVHRVMTNAEATVAALHYFDKEFRFAGVHVHTRTGRSSLFIPGCAETAVMADDAVILAFPRDDHVEVRRYDLSLRTAHTSRCPAEAFVTDTRNLRVEEAVAERCQLHLVAGRLVLEEPSGVYFM